MTPRLNFSLRKTNQNKNELHFLPVEQHSSKGSSETLLAKMVERANTNRQDLSINISF